jgi:hypothetical protein
LMISSWYPISNLGSWVPIIPRTRLMRYLVVLVYHTLDDPTRWMEYLPHR